MLGDMALILDKYLEIALLTEFAPSPAQLSICLTPYSHANFIAIVKRNVIKAQFEFPQDSSILNILLSFIVDMSRTAQLSIKQPFDDQR